MPLFGNAVTEKGNIKINKNLFLLAGMWRFIMAGAVLHILAVCVPNQEESVLTRWGWTHSILARQTGQFTVKAYLTAILNDKWSESCTAVSVSLFQFGSTWTMAASLSQSLAQNLGIQWDPVIRRSKSGDKLLHLFTVRV